MKPVELSATADAKITLVTFGGIANGIGIPPFEFRRMTDSFSANKVFVRDTGQKWYQAQAKGGLFRSLSQKDALTVQQWLSTTRTVFIGNSMGGFAAIFFGSLLGADRVVAFAPQTFVSPLLRLQHCDHRWARQILSMYARYGLIRDSYNLRATLLENPVKGRIDIFYGETSRLDALHAAQLSDLPGVNVVSVPGAGHGTVRRLRESGELLPILSEACALE